MKKRFSPKIVHTCRIVNFGKESILFINGLLSLLPSTMTQ